MPMRIQQLNGDTVLEITESKTVTKRLSERDLKRQKKYYEEAIAKFQGKLAEIEANISLVHEQKNAA